MFKNLVIKCVCGVARLCLYVLSKKAYPLLINLIFNKMPKVKYFNYQVAFKVNDDERIIFAGKTAYDPDGLFKSLNLRVSDNLNKLPVEQFIYQPVNNSENETKKN